MKRIISLIIMAVLSLTLFLQQITAAGSAAGGNLGSAFLRDYNTPCTIRWSFDTISGGIVDYQTYAGKVVVLVLFRADGLCGNSNSTIRSIANSDWVSNDGIKVIAVGVDGSGDRGKEATLTDVIAYKQKYAPDCDYIEFCYASNSEFWRNVVMPFYDLVGEERQYTGVFAYNYVIDQNNNYRFTWQGSYEADYYAAALSLIDSSVDGDTSKLALYNLKISGTNDYDAAYEVLGILNQYRRQNGLNELVMDKDLLETAMLRAAETAIYWDHARPNGTGCQTAAPLGFDPNKTSENIAAGYLTPDDVMYGWKHSAGHNRAMLYDANQSVGIGCFIDSTGARYWTQFFSFEAGTSEAVESSGTKSVTQDIAVSGGLLNIDVELTSLKLRQDKIQTITLNNNNYGGYNTRPEVGITYAESQNTDVAEVSISDNGKLTVIPVSEGTTVIKVGFASAGMGAPLTYDISVTVMPPYDSGDINCDGKVDVQDGVLMQRILAKLETNPEYLARADLNEDGKIDVQDGVKMQRILAHLE